MDAPRAVFGKARRRKPLIDYTETDPFVAVRDLPDYGIQYHPSHLRRLWQADPPTFPRPTRLTARKLAWRRSELEAWIAERVAAQDKAT